MASNKRHAPGNNLELFADYGSPLDRVAYALDVLLPVVDLGQDKAWVAEGAVQVWAWVG